MRDLASLPVHESMRRPLRVRKFRRNNEEHGFARKYRAVVPKPWKHHHPTRSAA